VILFIIVTVMLNMQSFVDREVQILMRDAACSSICLPGLLGKA